ncbi:uncharacterized protein [Engystomops pustulosus]|uniref:uncharacterized protein isoform X2 n=1 Tax=Engystomops pustulosus TaxID=76066 RepID=UPI003AFA8C91
MEIQPEKEESLLAMNSESIPENTVINLSQTPLETDCISALSKGLNYSLPRDFDFVQFQIDLYKSIRKIALRKLFDNMEGGRNDNRVRREGEIPCIGPLGFQIDDPLEGTDLTCLTTLTDLMTEINNTDDSLIDTDIQLTEFRGGNRSTFCPPLPAGSSIDIFYEQVCRDVKSLIYPTSNPNLSMAEWKALQKLKRDKSLVIKPADKGGNIVVMSKEYYVEEAERQLHDTSTYVKLSSDPTFKYISQLRTILRRAVENKVLSTKTAEKLLPTFPKKRLGIFSPRFTSHRVDPPAVPLSRGSAR